MPIKQDTLIVFNLIAWGSKCFQILNNKFHLWAAELESLVMQKYLETV